jgi:hypothetical protein
MTGQFNLYGVLVPTLLGLMVAAYALKAVLSRALGRLGFYRWVWHPPLFNLALYVGLLGLLFSLLARMSS